MTHSTMNRRRFLQAAGLGAGALFLPSARGAGAQAADQPPMRLIILYTEHGVPHQTWDMREGMPATAAWERSLVDLSVDELSRCLRPLHRHRQKMLVVDGLSLATGLADPYGDAHAKGWCSSLTGGPAREAFQSLKSNATYPSLDQVIAAALRAQDPLLTDMTSLEFGIDQGNYHAALYRPGAGGGPVQRVPHQENPREALLRLFPRDTGAPRDPVREAQPDLMADLGHLYDQAASRLSGDDRQKLAAHRDLVRDTERRLRFLETLECRRPSLVEAPPGASAGEIMHAKTRSFFDLAAVALSCRMSRVMSLQWGWLPVDMIGGTGDLHHDYAHRSVPGLMNEPTYPLAVEVMSNYTATYATWVAELCDQLDAIPEGNGTLLDHTIVLWVGELADGAHGHDGWPVVMVGGGARFRTGRYLHVAHDTPTTSVSEWDNDEQRIGLPHNHLLVSVANAMGVAVDTVGPASVKARKSGLPEVSLRGPLAGLT
jgi:hypothetical protein